MLFCSGVWEMVDRGSVFSCSWVGENKSDRFFFGFEIWRCRCSLIGSTLGPLGPSIPTLLGSCYNTMNRCEFFSYL